MEKKDINRLRYLRKHVDMEMVMEQAKALQNGFKQELRASTSQSGYPERRVD